jgi:phytoene/squalene synthetase
MNIDLYKQTSFGVSKLLTRNYSTSFSLGILAFTPEYRAPIYAIYGYVRLADEIVDSFHGHDKRALLNEFREETERALERGISTNPVIHAFVLTVNNYGIEKRFIDAFLDSMAMDLDNTRYDAGLYDTYIYGSAEVVGLMCLRVFVNGDQALFDSLLGPARALGSAFQKVNFLRDIRGDIDERGRIYLPGVSAAQGIDDARKRQLEAQVESEFREALEGIRRLPHGVRLGVFTAYRYYVELFRQIKRANVQLLLQKRVRVSNSKKCILLLASYIHVRALKLC